MAKNAIIRVFHKLARRKPKSKPPDELPKPPDPLSQRAFSSSFPFPIASSLQQLVSGMNPMAGLGSLPSGMLGHAAYMNGLAAQQAQQTHNVLLAQQMAAMQARAPYCPPGTCQPHRSRPIETPGPKHVDCRVVVKGLLPPAQE